MGWIAQTWVAQDGPPSVDALIAVVAAGQEGTISLEQLSACGLSGAAVRARCAAGRLHRLYRGVYAVGHVALSRRGRAWAAVLACGPGAALAHRSAAAAWGIRRSASARIEVCTPRRARAGPPEIELHRPRGLAAADVTTLDGLPITSVARTLLDLAAVLDERGLQKTIHEAEVARLFDLRAVQAAMARANGHHGTGRLTAALAAYTPEPLLRSGLERRFLELCLAADLPRPRTNALVAGLEVDVLWPEARLVVELDGHAAHGTRRAFERDRERDAHLALAGQQVVRVTARQVGDHPDEVIALVSSVYRQRA